jgi:23S rRNA pseudouridine1911/1915/1917 synthase
MPLLELTVEEPQGRIDRYLAERFPSLTRSAVQRLIDEGAVLVNGRPTRPSYRPVAGDAVSLRLAEPEPHRLEPEPLPLNVLYEDEHLLVLDKPAGMVVHPGAGRASGTLVNALLAYRPDIVRADLDPQRPGIVHRLDRETSGLLVVAAHREAQAALQAMFKRREVHKGYLALVVGVLTPERGAIEAPIGRDPIHRRRMAVLAEGGRFARTEYVVREVIGSYALLEVTLVTGRTHQIRVHLASIGHPVVGDRVYGRRRETLHVPRQFLHAWRLSFEHPVLRTPLAFEAELPADLAGILDDLRDHASQGAGNRLQLRRR